MRLAPTLDLGHANERPELPGTFGALIAALSMKLRILVLPDGSVFDAKGLRSTGETEIAFRSPRGAASASLAP